MVGWTRAGDDGWRWMKQVNKEREEERAGAEARGGGSCQSASLRAGRAPSGRLRCHNMDENGRNGLRGRRRLHTGQWQRGASQTLGLFRAVQLRAAPETAQVAWELPLVLGFPHTLRTTSRERFNLQETRCAMDLGRSSRSRAQHPTDPVLCSTSPRGNGTGRR